MILGQIITINAYTIHKQKMSSSKTTEDDEEFYPEAGAEDEEAEGGGFSSNWFVEEEKEKKEKKKKQRRQGFTLYPIVRPPVFKPFFWDIGKLGKHAMSRLPEENDRLEMNIERLKALVWDAPSRIVTNNEARITSGHKRHHPKKMNDPDTDVTKWNESTPSGGKQGQSPDDRDVVKKYIARCGIADLFMAMTTEVLTYRPAAPINHLLHLLGKMKYNQVVMEGVAMTTGVASEGHGEWRLKNFLSEFDATRTDEKWSLRKESQMMSLNTLFSRLDLTSINGQAARDRLTLSKYHSVSNYLLDVVVVSAYQLKHDEMKANELEPPNRTKSIKSAQRIGSKHSTLSTHRVAFNDYKNRSRSDMNNNTCNLHLYQGDDPDFSNNTDSGDDSPGTYCNYPVVVLYHSHRNRQHEAVVEVLRKYAETNVFLDAVLVDVEKQRKSFIKWPRETADVGCKQAIGLPNRDTSQFPTLQLYRKGLLAYSALVKNVLEVERDMLKALKHDRARWRKRRPGTGAISVSTRQQLDDVISGAKSTTTTVLFYASGQVVSAAAREMMLRVARDNSSLNLALIDLDDFTIDDLETRNARHDRDVSVVIQVKRKWLRKVKGRLPVVQVFRDGCLAGEELVDGGEHMEELLHVIMEREETLIRRRRSAVVRETLGDMACLPGSPF